MTRKEQNKILDAKIESNVNQYKVDRLNAEISAFSNGDLNKYEFLTRKDLKYKPNALDKAKFEFSPLGKAFSMGLDKTSQGYQEEGVIKLLKDIRDGLTGGVIRPNRPDNDDNNRPDNDDNNRLDNDDYDDDNNDIDNYNDDYDDDDDDDDNDDNKVIIENLLNEINKINYVNKQHNHTINNINKKNDDYLKKIKEQNDDIKKLKKEVIDNKKMTKDILHEAGKKINKFYQEKSMYYNELKYELRKNSELIEERYDIFRDLPRHTRSDESEKQIVIDVLNRDIERLNNLNKENLNKVYKYKEKIKKLNDNLSSEKKVKKELEKIYENLKEDNEHLIFDFDGIKMVNEILMKDNNIFKQKIEELEKELEKSEEYINIDSKTKDKK